MTALKIAKQTIRKDDGFRVPCTEENAIIMAEEVIRLNKALISATELIDSINYRNKARNEWLAKYAKVEKEIE